MSQTNENSEREKKETAFFLNIKEMPDDVIESKIVYLESIYNSENTRQHKIETKLAATVGYCSVLSGIIGIIGIVGVKDIFHSTDMWINVLTLVLFCLPILFCGISIVLSMYTLRPQVYRRLEPGLILDDGDMGNNAHRKKYLESMYKSIMLNYETNHSKMFDICYSVIFGGVTNCSTGGRVCFDCICVIPSKFT